jgi:hypothetical protein
MSTQNSVVAVYRSHTEGDQALKELQSGGVDMRKLSRVSMASILRRCELSFTRTELRAGISYGK